ncbi:MAG: fused MFS/spermidine synthase [Chloroflexi bacterium]|nr:fused MFS/spermidine synthase [Chloroflexota bacterium]
MNRIALLWKANTIAFISSFCVMVIELIASRIMAPHIGVSLYTWTSIIGVILAGIALGNYFGGRIADKHPSPLVLASIFLLGGLLTIAILPATKVATSPDLFSNLPVVWNITLKTSLIFFLPAIVLSMVSPLVIKLTLANLEQTGGIVGTIYACSTAGSILGTFMTGFYFILWFGTRTTVWLVGAILILTGVTIWFTWRVPGKWNFSLKNFIMWMGIVEVILTYTFLFQLRESWQEQYTRESNYYTIQVSEGGANIKVLRLDNLVHSYNSPGNPAVLVYRYVQVFDEITRYLTRANQSPRTLHLGGGGYTFPLYLEIVYPKSINEVVEIDPVVTEIAHEELGLPLETSIKTYNQDARFFLIQRKPEDKYNIVIGDVFNDRSTPYHLTTVEFAKLVKDNMAEDGVYLVNIVDDYKNGRYMPSFVHTLKQAFNYVYLFNTGGSWDDMEIDTFVIAATDQRIDLTDYRAFVTGNGKIKLIGDPYNETKLEQYLAARELILLTDDHAPTDILVAPLFAKRHY